MANTDFSIALRNYAGVPVVELVGELNKKTLARLNDILGQLAGAGHYHVMINLKRAAWHNLTALASLEKAARTFRSHYGNLDVIAESAQINGLLESRALAAMLRFCTSEGQAFRRIRRLPAPAENGVKPLPAHLADKR